MDYHNERTFHSRKLVVHNKSSSNAILSSFIRQKYGDIDYWKMKEVESNQEKLNKSMKNYPVTSKMKITSRKREPSFFFPINDNLDRDMTISRYGNNKNEKQYPSKYVIELAVFIDHKLYEILGQTFPRNTRESVSNVVLAMIDMVSDEYFDY